MILLLYQICYQACCGGTLRHCDITWKQNLACVGIVMASEGYPEKAVAGRIVTGNVGISFAKIEIMRNYFTIHLKKSG